MTTTATQLAVDVELERGRFVLNASFAMPHRVTGLIGHSGSGKTTLLHLIAGLLRPARGRMALGDHVWCDTAQGIWVPPHARRIGVVFQDTRLLPHFTVERNLRYGMRAEAGGISFDELVALMELSPMLGKRPDALSGGEAQRVAIGRALLAGPQLLLLDEPLTGLDHRLRERISTYIERVCTRVAIPILYISHDLSEVLQHTPHAILMDRGSVAGVGTLREIAADQHAFPVVRDLGLLNLLSCVISDDQHAGDDLVAVSIGDGPAESRARSQLHVAHSTVGSLASGGVVKIAIRPQDIALATQRIEGTSIQNQLCATVTATHVHERSVIVEVDCNDETILVEVSQRALRDLALQPGSDVWLLIKTNALRVVSSQPG